MPRAKVKARKPAAPSQPTPEGAPPLATTSHSSSSPPSAPPPPPLLPSSLGFPSVSSRVEAFLGFIGLMDSRAVSRELQRRFEKAALVWLRAHTTKQSMQRRAEERERARLLQANDDSDDDSKAGADDDSKAGADDDKEDGGDEKKEEKEEVKDEKELELEQFSVSLPQPSVTMNSTRELLRAHAVWYRQQLHRWRLHGGQRTDDPLLVSVTFADSRATYGFWSSGKRCEIPEVKGRHRHITSLLLIDLATWAFQATSPFDHLDPTYPEQVKKSALVRRSRGYQTEKVDRERVLDEIAHIQLATQHWMCSSTGAPLLLRLPVDVLLHSILALIDFEPLMDLRSVSRSFQPLVERAAVQWCNRRFPEGLATIQRLLQEAGEKASAKTKAQNESKTTGKRRRGSETTLATASALSSTSSASSARASSVSYVTADAVWVRQQLNWARKLVYNQEVFARHAALLPPPPVVSKVDAMAAFPLTAEQWSAAFQAEQKKQRWGYFRPPVIDVISVALRVYGHVQAMLLLQEKRAAAAAKRQEKAKVKAQEKMRAVDLALAAEGLTAEWKEPGKRLMVGSRTFFWVAGQVGRWCTPFREVQQLVNPHGLEQRRIHRALSTVALQCAGRCGWGGCSVAPQEDDDDEMED